MYKHEGMLAFGCGCKGAAAAAVPANANRQTIYQVINTADQAIVAEFSTLPEARAKAVEIAGRVRVTNKTV